MSKCDSLRYFFVDNIVMVVFSEKQYLLKC